MNFIRSCRQKSTKGFFIAVHEHRTALKELMGVIIEMKVMMEWLDGGN